MNDEKQRPRRRWPWVVLAAALTLALPATWLLAHRLSSRTLPPAPWSEAELPVIPDGAENGLDELVAPGAAPITTIEPSLHPLLRPLERVMPDARWAEAGRRQDELRAWFDADPGLRASELAQIDSALAARHFADPCTGVGSDCRWVSVINLARVAVAADLVAALRGDWSEAFARGHALRVASDKLLVSARASVANMIALVLAHMATDHLRVLVAGYRIGVAGGTARATTAELRPVFDATASALDSLRREALSPRRAVIAESLWLRTSIAPILEDPGANGAAGGFISPYLLDARGTVATIDAHFVEVMRWVEAPDHATRPAPRPRQYASGPGWWLWNPVGKMLLDVGGVDVTRLIRQMDTSADALFTSRAALRRELRAPLL